MTAVQHRHRTTVARRARPVVSRRSPASEGGHNARVQPIPRSKRAPEFEYRTSVPGLCARAGGWPRACAGGLTWSVIGRAGVRLLRGFRVVHRVMHLMSGSVAGSAWLAFLGTRLLHLLTGRLARYALSQHSRCRGHGNSSRERDDRRFHDVLLRQAPQCNEMIPMPVPPGRMFMSVDSQPAKAEARSINRCGESDGFRKAQPILRRLKERNQSTFIALGCAALHCGWQ